MEHFGEAEQFELRRSPRAQISQRIATVDHDGQVGREHPPGAGEQRLERHVDGAANMKAAVLPRGQDVDDLGAVCDGFEHLAMVNDAQAQGSVARRRPVYARTRTGASN
jgi:hypothetical protein